jgi:hypothetical protein
MIGLEGIFGIMFIFVWIMLLTFIPCPTIDLCDVTLSKNSILKFLIAKFRIGGSNCCGDAVVRKQDYFVLGLCDSFFYYVA